MNNAVEEKFNRMAQSIEPSAGFSQELWSKMKDHSLKKSTPKRMPRRLWIPATALLAVMLVVVIATPQGVLAAFRSLLSYIPGVGFMQTDDATLYLAEPVIVEQDGYIFTLDQVVADAEKVVVAYHIDKTVNDFSNCSYNINRLLLPDGKSNLPIGGGASTAAEGVNARIEYFPLAAEVKQASVFVATDPENSACNAPKEWSIPFKLGTEKPDVEFLPVVENMNPQSTDEQNLPASSSTDSDVRMVVDKYVELADGYLLNGHVENLDASWLDVSIDWDSISATDTNGREVSIEPPDQSLGDGEFAVKVVGKDFAAPLNFQVKKLWIFQILGNGPSFSFESGSDPQVGQSWTIDQELIISGIKMQIKEVSLVNQTDLNGNSTNQMSYHIQVNTPERLDVFFDCTDQVIHSNGGSAMPLGGGDYMIENDFNEGLPVGQITCVVKNASFIKSGEWQFDWEPISDLQ